MRALSSPPWLVDERSSDEPVARLFPVIFQPREAPPGRAPSDASVLLVKALGGGWTAGDLPENSRGSTSRSFRMWSAVGRWLSFSETRMSASEVPDHVRGAVDPVDGAVGQADVVEDHVELRGRDLAPDRGLHQVRDARRLLDAGAGLGPHVQADLAAVGVREEVPPQVRREQEREQADAQEDRDEEPAVLHQAREQVAIAGAQPLEAPIERALGSHEGVAARRRAFVPRLQQV